MCKEYRIIAFKSISEHLTEKRILAGSKETNKASGEG